MPDPARILREAYDNVRHEYGTAIGQRRDELITPALVLDVDAAQRNIDHMASELKQMGAAIIRPHYKAHKNPDLARRQLQAGAGGLSMATVWEAAILAAAGMDDLFVVNTVAHPAKLRVLAGWPGITGCSSRWTRPRTPRPSPLPPSRRGRRSESWSRWTPAWTAAGWMTQRTAWRWPGR